MNLLNFLFFFLFLIFSYSYSEEFKTSLTSLDSSVLEVRIKNIDLMRSVLKKGEYRGYDIIIISSTTEAEAEFQQQFFEKIFKGTTKKDGSTPIILSVVDWTEGGQLIGAIVYTWLKAEEKMNQKYSHLMSGYRDFIDYIKAKKCKVAAFHNGGKGERCSPLTQSLGNSRGSQKLVGSIENAHGEEIDLDVLLGVVLQCSSFADTNDGNHIDTFWTSQIAFGSNLHVELKRSNFALDKFLVGFNKEHLIPQNIVDFGTAALNQAGQMTAFYGNKRFALRKGNHYVIDHEKIKKELFSKGERFAYDFGSFSTSIEMWQLLIDYWKRKIIFSSIASKGMHTPIKRDIDPHFIQPFIRFLYGINNYADRDIVDIHLPSPSDLQTAMQLHIAQKVFDLFLKEKFPVAYQYIWEDANNETDTKKKEEAVACMQEVMEFYVLYRLNTQFQDLKKIFGFIDLGDKTQWFRYRRPIDIMNEKFEMLTALIGKKIETQLNGFVQEFDANEVDFQRSGEARRMRGITDEKIAQFMVEGKVVTLSLAEVKAGKTIEDVYVKNSIIQNCDLTKGSSIINSVVNNIAGKVFSIHSYLESSIAPLIEAETSVVHQVIDLEQIQANSEIVSDVYKSKLIPEYHGRMRAPIGYDPKGIPIFKVSGKNSNGELIYSHELDETVRYFIERISYDLKEAKEYSDKTARTEDGKYTFEEIREIEPIAIADRKFRELIALSAKVAVYENRLNTEISINFR